MDELITRLTERITLLETKMSRQEKAMRKLKKEMIPESERVPRKPSGFAKPAYLSPGLCLFLDVPVDTELARTEVTKRILQYVKDNDRQDPSNKRVIRLDDKLQKLLEPAEGEEVSYFNIQRLLKKHYQKPEVEPVAEAEPVPVATPLGGGKKSKKAKK
jgi:upstream activation factor subunit UAF30